VKTDPIVLDVDRAVPIGLILSELITNALKYGFPDDRTGEISVELREGGDKQYLITVRDNGVGLPEAFDIHNSPGLGLQLVNGLATQLNGTVEIHRDGGAIFEIRFSNA
jgi:two-component sensor histidine kinase